VTRRRAAPVDNRHHQRDDHRSLGIVKADVAIKDGLTHAIGKAGIPTSSRALPSSSGRARGSRGRGENPHARRLRHPHPYICPQQIDDALMSGVSPRLRVGGTGPATCTLATTCTPSPWHHRKDDRGGPTRSRSTLGFAARQRLEARRPHRADRRGAAAQTPRGLGAPPAAIDCLPVGRPTITDVQVIDHTDTLNESGYSTTPSRPSRPHASIFLPPPRARARPLRPNHEKWRAAEVAALVNNPNAPPIRATRSTNIWTC